MSDRYGLEIRAMSEADASGLAELIAEAGAAEPATVLAARLAQLRRQPGVALVATAWGPPNGAAVATWRWGLERDAPSAELAWLLVAPEARRRGVGRLLLKAVAQAARQAGCTELSCRAGDDRPGLLAFCRASGFEPAAGAAWTRNLRKRA